MNMHSCHSVITITLCALCLAGCINSASSTSDDSAPEATNAKPGEFATLYPLHHAVSFTGTDTEQRISALLEEGADPNAIDGAFGQAPLHWAARLNPYPKYIIPLLDGGASPNLRDNDGRTPFHYLAERIGRSPFVAHTVITAMLNNRANYRLRDNDGNTPLHLAARSATPNFMREMQGDKPDGITVMLNAGADPNARNNDGGTPLHYAALSGDPINITNLVVAGSSHHARDKWHETPLHYAARKGNPAVIAALLDAKADICARNEKGQTPLDIAESAEGNANNIDLLRKSGAAKCTR